MLITVGIMLLFLGCEKESATHPLKNAWKLQNCVTRYYTSTDQVGTVESVDYTEDFIYYSFYENLSESEYSIGTLYFNGVCQYVFKWMSGRFFLTTKE